jgi:hypothetical protein
MGYPGNAQPAATLPGDRKRMAILLALLLVALAGLVFLRGPEWFGGLRAVLTGQESGTPKGGDAAIHSRVLARIEALRSGSRELPPCPLVLPLTDPRRAVTPLGSYLSYLGMKRAAYLPDAIYRIPNIGEVFNRLGLFEPGMGSDREPWRQELSFRFQARDFGEGGWIERPDGYAFTLRFYGTRPEKSFGQVFARDHLYQVPAWIARCIHDWTGFKPMEDQARFLQTPIFTNDGDLARGAEAEPVFRSDPALAFGWDAILATNPDNAFLYDRWRSMTEHREHAGRGPEIAARLARNPHDTLLRLDWANELSNWHRPEEAFGLLAEELLRDDNNGQLYDMAVQSLRKLKCYEEAVTLLKVWTEKHPDNQEAWMALGEEFKAYAWVARGTGWASTVTPDGWRLMRERMGEAVKAATRATQVAPRDCRTWTTLLAMGTGAQFPPERMAQYFARVLELDPYHYWAYDIYANYLQPKWFGDEDQIQAFADQYAERFPLLTYPVVAETFMDREEAKDEAARAAKVQRQAERVLRSPYLGKFTTRLKAYLRTSPWDFKYWRYYMYWMVKIGRRDETLAFAKATLAPREALKLYYPSLVLAALDQEAENQVGRPAREAYWKRTDVVALQGRALRDLVAADPGHWAAWNRLARFETERGNDKEARAALGRIGDHWVASVWPREAFDKARARL